MSIQVYNTLTKKKAPFKPLNEDEVKIYLCGPTVYDFLHIGNFRGAITFNLIRNWLEHSGYKVNFVYNYTDVDDKIIKRANAEGVDSSVISERFIKEFEQDWKRLGLKKHEHNPKVTEHIPQIIKLIEDIIANGHGYAVDGEVFFSVKSFDNYGKLSGKKLDELEVGERIEVDPKKKYPHDFVLWKPSKENEPSWDSPWGKGRPGWHIECSAMIRTILGDSIDIHGGGIDLIFPHHENEIAQGEAASGGKLYCQNWMHNNFINMKDEKMSKSLGNVISAREFMDKYHPEILKYLILSVHYRTMLTIDEERITQSLSGLGRIYQAIREADEVIKLAKDGGDKPLKTFKELLDRSDKKITKALNDDFNAPEATSVIFEVVRQFNALNLSKKLKDPASKVNATLFKEWTLKYGSMFALFNESPNTILTRIDDILLEKKGIKREMVEELVAKRDTARESKDFAAADKYRNELSALDILLLDSADGKSRWEVKKTLD